MLVLNLKRIYIIYIYILYIIYIALLKVLTVAHKFNVVQDVNNPVSSVHCHVWSYNCIYVYMYTTLLVLITFIRIFFILNC